MFGEKPIVGKKIIKLDSKGRIIIPEFTGVEDFEKDFVITRFSPIEGIVCIKIQKSNQFQKRIDALKAIRESVTDPAKAEDAYQEMVELCLNAEARAALVDKQHRMQIPAKLRKDFFGEIEEQRKVACLGAFDSLYVFASEAELDEFMQRRKKI